MSENVHKLLMKDPVIRRFIAWAEPRQDTRAVILTSSRASNGTEIDEFSDYDIILVVNNIRDYLNDSWLGDFGDVLTVYRDPVREEFGFERFTRVTQYEDGLKIDFTVWPLGLLRHVAGLESLPGYLDDGFHVLLDKDGLADGAPAPTYSVFVIKPPTEKEFRNKVEYFFSNACYLPKQIYRGDLLCTVLTLESAMKQEDLLPMLEWKVGLESGWTVKAGLGGKRLSKYLDEETRMELEKTWTGGSSEERWLGLFRLITLFRRMAGEVATGLDYYYPQEMDDRTMRYLERIREKYFPQIDSAGQ